jgi:hypothetical protein
MSISNRPEAMSKPAVRDLIILALLLAFPSTGVIQKHAGLAGVAAYLAIVTGALFLTWRFGECFAPWMRRRFLLLAGLAFAGLAVGFAVLHPMEESKGLGKSSDRDDGLNLAATRMSHGESPYYPSHPLIGPLSVLPGSVVLAAPFVALADSGYQNLFWLAALLATACWMFRDQALALVLLTVPLAASPAALYEYVSGGDLLTNGIFLSVFFLLAMKSWTKPGARGWEKWTLCVLLGIGLASRSNFLLLTPLFGAVMWRSAGFGKAIAATTCAVFVAATITIPFYLNDPAGFTPLLAKQKLALVDRSLPWASTAMIGTTALTSLLGAWTLLRNSSADPLRSFFRWCTLVTLCPMACAVSLSSVVNGRLDFSFMLERFGLMYVAFALLGWGDQLLRVSEGLRHSTKEALP